MPRLWYPCSLTRCTGVFLSRPLNYLPPLLVLQIRRSGPEDRTSLVVYGRLHVASPGLYTWGPKAK
jgi:hypothetical protein